MSTFFIYNKRIKELDLSFYLNHHDDLVAAFGADLKQAYNHYLNFGYWENRSINSSDILNFYSAYKHHIQKNKKFILIFHHAMHGGSDEYVKSLMNLLSNDYNFIIMTYGYNKCFWKFVFPQKDFTFIYSSNDIDFLKQLNIEYLFVNHLINNNHNIVLNVIEMIKKPMLCIIHDYYYLSDDMTYFKESRNKQNQEKIDSIISKCQTIFVPSATVGGIMYKYLRDLGIKNIQHLPHEKYHVETKIPFIINKNNGDINRDVNNGSRKKLIIGFVGVPAYHKGLAIIQEIDKNKQLWTTDKYEFDFLIIGPNTDLVNIRSTGKYDGDSGFHKTIEQFNPDILCVASICEETYCYTFTLAMTTGKPLIVLNNLIFQERGQNLNGIIFFPKDITGIGFLNQLSITEYPTKVSKLLITEKMNPDYSRYFKSNHNEISNTEYLILLKLLFNWNRLKAYHPQYVHLDESELFAML
jgi:hypothetical protein